MEYPLISEYRDAILSAQDNFNELASLRPVLDDYGNPVMSSGNFAVVFKMRDDNDGKLYAIKCFIKDQEGRNGSYQKIADELEVVSSSYILPLRYLENELFVDSGHCDSEEFAVVVMEWVEGETLDTYLNRNLDDKYELEMLSYRFNRMAAWLLAQPFAHGDLKPDNILVRNDGSLVLVDYDGMFVPSMKGGKAREIGSPDYRHPMRTDADFNEHIDDFSIAAIALSLKTIALNPELKSKERSMDSLLFSEKDYHELSGSAIIGECLKLMVDSDFALLFGAFSIALAKNRLDLVSFRLFMTCKPKKPKSLRKRQIYTLSTEVSENDIEEGIADEFGVIYSKDRLRLLKCPVYLKLSDYQIKLGTKVICDRAFSGCDSLKSVTIPDSVLSMGINPFSASPNVKIKLTQRSDFRVISDLLISSSGVLISCLNRLEFVKVPSFVTAIGDEAFSTCDSLQSIKIPDSVTKIGDGAFLWCSSLQSITIPYSVTSIVSDTFACCTALQSVTIPNSVTSIGNSAFESCQSLRGVTIPDSVTSIGADAFSCCILLESIMIPNSVSSIEEGVFTMCKSLHNVIIPNSVTSIGDWAFFECESLQSITIPDSVTSIGKNAFARCDSLQRVRIPDSVTSIGASAFPSKCKLVHL